MLTLVMVLATNWFGDSLHNFRLMVPLLLFSRSIKRFKRNYFDILHLSFPFLYSFGFRSGLGDIFNSPELLLFLVLLETTGISWSVLLAGLVLSPLLILGSLLLLH